jgi:ligand-binding SRPBCC domain-containing protein
MSSGSYEFTLSSELPARPEVVWAHATNLRGVNRELMPLARMTWPRDRDTLRPEDFSPGQRLFRSWILLLGLLPVDYDDLTLLEFEPGRRFLEHSTMLTQRQWVHERTVEPTARGCRVTDSIRFVPRLAWLGPLHRAAFLLAFRLRHYNLRRLFANSRARHSQAPYGGQM